ncbi:Mitochondrial copper homeostasis protein [Thecaphora frezii]
MPPSSAPASSASAALDDGDARKPEDFIKVMGGKQPSKFTDPCAKAAKQSMKCLDDNNYDRTKCGPFFNQYRECKKAWITQRREDRLNNRPGAFD